MYIRTSISAQFSALLVVCIPYFLNQTLQLLFISTRDSLQLIFEGGH